MTRKKSNVKALALAVTCAILAGGGIGLNPVYAADALTLYKEVSGNVTTSAKTDGTDNTVINELTVGGVSIGSSSSSPGISVGDSSGYVHITKTDVHASNSLIAPTITTGFARMENGNIIAKDSLSIGYEYDSATNTYKNIKFKVDGNDGSFKAAGDKFTVDGNGAIKADSLTLADNYNVKDKIDANKKSTEDNKAALVALNKKTKDIEYENDGSTTVDGVNFNDGAVSGVKSINGKIEISNDGKTVIFNKDVENGQVQISESGIKVGTGSTYVSGDAVYTGGVDYANAKAGMKNDGSLKATNFAVEGATGNTTVGGDLTVAGTATFAKETTFGKGIKTDVINEATADQGVTVDGVLLKDKGITAAGNIQGTDITATGALKGQTLGIGGADNDKFIVDENGNTTVGGTLGVTGKTTLSNELQVDGKATFGSATGANTVIEGDEVKTGRIETNKTKASYIGGVTLLNGQITADSMTINGNIDLENLKVKNELTVGTNTKITEGTLKLGTADDNKLTADKLANINQTIKSGRVIDANSATIGGVGINGGDVTTATGTIKGNTITDGNGFTATDGQITAKEGKIGNVVINAAGAVTGVKSIEASTFKVDDNNLLNNNGITAKGGKIGVAVINETTLAVGDTELNSAEGITTKKLKIAGMTLTGTSLDTNTADFQVNGVTFNQGKVTAKASEGFVAGNSFFKQGSLIVDDNNKLEATNGLTTEKATVKGALDVTGKATFGAAGQQTTIDGKTVTTDILKANKLILGASGDKTVEVDKDGSLIAAKGKFKVDEDGALKAANGAFNVDKDGKTTFKKDDNNLTSINGGNIWAKATDVENHTSSVLQHDSKGLHVKGNKSGQESAFDFDTSTGIGTFTGQDKTTTTINGSNLTLTNGANSTALTAGGATFTGAAGEKGGKVTTINGGTITTDTLNVERINLGGEVIDKGAAGVETNSKLYMDAQGNFRAAEGNFTVKGGTGTDRGALHNEVGKTSFDTTETGASMKFDNTAVTGGVTSEVTVEANKATVAAGDQASFVATTNDGGTATITGGTQIVTTTGNGTVFENSANKNAFVTGGATNTIINGNEITTGKITTDQLVITGQGNADGNGGSIAFGGDGTIKSDINDGQPNGKNTSFETTLDGVNTKVTNGTTTTENKVTAAGNSNTVTKDATHKSEFNQGFTSIGGVVTNGTVKMSQELTADGVKFEQTGYDEVNIAKGDVTVKNNRNTATPNQEVHLSDLGSLNNLDGELAARDEYQNNKTAVGAINAEAGIRREEVARLDNRIDDVNNRVDKVGAMAAAIASLKSIGYDPQAPSEFSIGLGQYKGETGVAMGFFHYPNKNFMINVSLSTAGGETMGGIGATWRFGHKSPQKLLEEQREAQAKKELAAAEKYQAAAKLAKEAQERAEYAAKLARQAQVSADNAKAAADATQAKHFG